jgi:hypothetical protein
MRISNTYLESMYICMSLLFRVWLYAQSHNVTKYAFHDILFVSSVSYK